MTINYETDIPKKEKENKDNPGFGITEAPKEHPDNVTGNMKVIME